MVKCVNAKVFKVPMQEEPQPVKGAEKEGVMNSIWREQERLLYLSLLFELQVTETTLKLA